MSTRKNSNQFAPTCYAVVSMLQLPILVLWFKSIKYTVNMEHFYLPRKGSDHLNFGLVRPVRKVRN